MSGGIEWESPYETLQKENKKLRAVIEEAIDVIGDGNNGPPFFYADIFEKLQNTLRRAKSNGHAN